MEKKTQKPINKCFLETLTTDDFYSILLNIDKKMTILVDLQKKLIDKMKKV